MPGSGNPFVTARPVWRGEVCLCSLVPGPSPLWFIFSAKCTRRIRAIALLRKTGGYMRKMLEKIQEELLAMLPPTIYFLISLGLVAEVRVLMLKGIGISVGTQVQVVIGALILGKAVLVSDMLPFINRYPDKPLAFNIVWKTAIYFVVALLIHYIEHLIDFWRQAGGLIAGNRKLFAEIIWPHFWAIQIILLVLIFNYCVAHELARLIGRKQALQMFFGRPLDAAAWSIPR